MIFSKNRHCCPKVAPCTGRSGPWRRANQRLTRRQWCRR